MNLAVVGTGNIVKRFLDGVSKSEGICCRAVCSRKAESGRKFVQSCNSLAEAAEEIRIYTDYDELLADDGIELIYIALPNSLHFEYTKRALHAGRHVICEKPFTVEVKQAEELIALAEEKQIFLFEAITTRSLPNYKRIREELSKLGRIRMVQCNFSQYSSRYDEYLAGGVPNVFSPAFSGGALNDLNVYNLHFVAGLFGMPAGGSYAANVGRNGIDLSGVAVLHYDGFQAVCIAAKDSASPNFALIQGEKGYLKIEGESSRCRRAEVCVDGRTERFGEEQSEENALVYEVLEFEKIMKENDFAACRRLLSETRMVVEILASLRG